MLPNLYTTIDVPTIAQCVEEEMFITYEIGNNGNDVVTWKQSILMLR